MHPLADRALRLTGICIAVLLSVASGLRATTLRYVPFEEQVDSSRVIVLGTVESQAAGWNATHNLIFTRVVVRVEQVLKGAPGGTVTLNVPGGVVDGMGQSVDGAPSFVVGGRYVLFLDPTAAGLYRVAGFSQGSYAVAAGPSGKAKVSPQLAAPGSVRLLGGETATRAGGISLDEFISRIRARLDSKSVRKVEP